MAGSWINNILSIFSFSVKCGNLYERQNEHPSTQMPHSQKFPLKSTIITCRNLQMSDVCSAQIRHISCLVQSLCCHLILQVNVRYIQLQFRHNSPFHMD